MKVRDGVHGSIVFLSIFISLVGYCRNGSIPALQPIISVVFSSPTHSASNGDPPPEQEPGESGQLQLLSQSLSGCACPKQQDNIPNHISNNSLSSLEDSPTLSSSLISSRVSKVLPFEQLRKKVSLARYGGLPFLDRTALNRYYLCNARKSVLDRLDVTDSSTKRSIECKEKSFLNRTAPIVALISFPGSGNTWVRYLLEQTTGVFTGSIYCDPSLKAVFPGEYIAGGNVVAVKTHRGNSRELPEDVQLATGKTVFDKAVVIVRDPFDALVSEANRRWNSKRAVDSHVGVADETAFISNSKWDWHVEYKSSAWGYLLHTWLGHTHFPVHVVQYEKLLTDFREELSSVLQFLGFPVDEDTLRCAEENSGGHFKRLQHLNFNPYTTQNIAVVNRVLSQATPLLAHHGITYPSR